MADFELEDSQGNRYRIRRGAGPQFWHSENLAGGSTLLADELLCNVPVSSIDAAHDYFYSDVLTSLPNRQSSPQGALSDALSSSHLTIEKIGTALVISDDVPDPRNELIVKIRNALTAIVAGERAEAAMHTRLLDEENTFTKSMIYTGAFMQGIGSSAWGMVVWLKEVSDVVNPFVKMQHHAKALQAAWESEDFSKTYSDTYVKGEKRELVEAIGFDPTAITEQQIDEAMAMTSLVMDDPSVRGMLYQFTKDYAEAQHAIEVTNVIGSAVFEIILAIVMAAVTGGVGVIAAVGSKAHLIKKFQKVGDLLQDFAKATRSLKLQAKKRKTKSNQNAALPVEKVDAKKTDAHGAEDGKPSDKKDQDYGVAFFGEDNVGYYTRENATIGREGKTFFFMPLEDSAVVKNSADAALYTGRAPSAEKAYLTDGDVFGLSFPNDGMKISAPTSADAAGWPHYLEGGHTAVKTGDGPNSGYLVNSTREFVTPGGSPVPEGSVLFKLGPNGEWIPIRSF
jgi:hypothetical protein